MRPRHAIWLAIVALSLVACASDRHGHEDDEHHGELHEGAADDAAHGEDEGGDLVRIDPEMLRDLRVTTSEAETRPGGEAITALGEVGVNEERYAEAGAPVAARVVEVLIGVGDDVTDGQPLAMLEAIELGTARGELSAARARAELARRTLARKRGLAAERVVPRREVQEAEAAAAAAVAELHAAEAALAALGVTTGAHEDGARFQLRSPLTGVVIERQVVRGQMAEPGRPLFRIADLSRLWLTVHAFERDAVRVAVGAAARVALAALPGRSFAGTVTLVGRHVDPVSRTVAVRIELANDDGVLRPGMSATAWLPAAGAGGPVVAVPAAALQRLNDGWSVFIPRGEGAFEARRVGRGRDLGGAVEILAGLAAGETVVVDGAFLLKAEAEKTRGEGVHHAH